MDDILSPSFLYAVLLILLLINLDPIIRISYRAICKIRKASNSEEVWKIRFSLEGAGIIAAIVALIFTAIEVRDAASDRKAEAIDRNWDVVYTREATRIRRTKALQNLARLGEPLERVDLSCATIEGKSQKSGDLSKCDKKVPLEYLDLSPEAVGIEKGVNLRRAKLINVNLFVANLTSANLIEADLTSADLVRTDLTSADLMDADLTGADLKWANFTSAYLVYTNLTAANLSNADFSDATISEETVLDYTWVWEGPGKEKTELLPIGTPKGWDTPLKPKYICPFGFFISEHINVSEYSSKKQEELKNALRQIMKENCRPYTNALE